MASNYNDADDQWLTEYMDQRDTEKAKISALIEEDNDLLTAHMSQMEEKTLCRLCGKLFGRDTNLQSHIRRHQRGYDCLQCKKPHACRKDLDIHMQRQHKERVLGNYHYVFFCL